MHQQNVCDAIVHLAGEHEVYQSPDSLKNLFQNHQHHWRLGVWLYLLYE